VSKLIFLGASIGISVVSAGIAIFVNNRAKQRGESSVIAIISIYFIVSIPVLVWAVLWRDTLLYQ